MSTILIVDDHAVNREYLVTLLGYGGHRLLEASNGWEALKSIRAEHPDLVIADILMPELDGYELVRRMREDEEIANTRVIFCTAAYCEGEARGIAQGCGVTDLLVKPLDPHTILDAVKEALARAPSIPELPASYECDRMHRRLLTDKLARKVLELEAEAEMRERREREARQAQESLERRLQEQAAELAAANRRLEHALAEAESRARHQA